MQLQNTDVLVRMFTVREPTPQQLEQKRHALDSLSQTFPLLNDDNFKEYVNYLQEWILNEVEDWAFRLFVSKIRMLHDFLKRNNRQDLCEQLLPINYQLLKQDDEATRKSAIQLTCEMLSSSYGGGYIRKFVQNHLKVPYGYPSYDSALTIFGRFRERFYDNNEYANIITHPNLYANYKSKKILANHLSVFAGELMPAEVLVVMVSATDILLKEEDQVIGVMALKARILLVWNSYKGGFCTAERCFQEIKPFYANELIRVKYTIIELTAQICEMLPALGVEFHFQYIKKNIKVNEPQLTEMSIRQLKNIFQKVSKPQQQSLLQRLLSQKSDVGIQQTIAANIIDLLIEVEKQEILVGFLSKFIKDQEESVLLILVKSFFKHEKSAHLYVYFKALLNGLYGSNKWRTRHQSLEILENVIDKFGVDEDMMVRLYEMIIQDPAHRIRIDSIRLVKRYIQDRQIQEHLVPLILNQYLNVDYLRRLMVLHFIEQTFRILINSPQMMVRYKQILQILSTDQVANVSDIARRLLHGEFENI